MQKKIIVYVYGTLRPGVEANLVRVPGTLHVLGGYPGARIKGEDFGQFFMAERCEVPQESMARLDSYEGYRQDRPEMSLFRRIPYLDGYIYEYNHDLKDREQITDWLEYTGGKSGTAAWMMSMDNSEEVV